MNNSTFIAIVLDRSGSMSSVRNDTIGGFNTFLKAQKDLGGDARLTLAQFDDQYEVVHENKPLMDVPELNVDTFVPRGGTALLDAIGDTINSTGKHLAAMPEDKRPKRVAFVIITDGQENSSKRFKKEAIKTMIEHQRDKYAWEFLYLGADLGGIADATSWGILRSNSVFYNSTAAGTAYTFTKAASKLCSFRDGTAKNMAYDDDEKQLSASIK